MKIILKKKEKYITKKLYENFYEVLKNPNYGIVRCINIILDIKIITKNIGSIVAIICFSSNIVSLFFYIFKGISPLKKRLKNEIKKNNIKLKSSIKNLLYPPIRKSANKKLEFPDIKKKKKKIKEKKGKKNLNKKNMSGYKNIKYSNLTACKYILDSSPKNEMIDSKESNEYNLSKKDIKINKKYKYTKKETIVEEKKIYNNFVFKKLKYNEAIKLDKRPFLQAYWDTLKRDHLLIFTFINCNDYNMLYIKLSRFIFFIVTNMALNAFFFSDYSIHVLYLNHGKYDFYQQIPQITYSVLISQIIDVFLCFLSMTDKDFYRLNKKVIAGNKKKINEIIRCINIKLILFNSITFAFIIIYWYIISIFCGIFRNTQMNFIANSAISISISFAYSFIIYFIFIGLRIISLRDSNKRLKCIYNFSCLIPFF